MSEDHSEHPLLDPVDVTSSEAQKVRPSTNANAGTANDSPVNNQASMPQTAGSQSSKQLPDQKTIDALLAITRLEHEQSTERKIADTSNLPKGLMSGYISRIAHDVSPEALGTSSKTRWRAIIVIISVLALTVLSFVVDHLVSGFVH